MAKPDIYDARHHPLVRRDIIQKRYRISRRTLDTWMKDRRIPVIKVGRILLFSVEACDKALGKFETKATE
jgi:hypothetical protein